MHIILWYITCFLLLNMYVCADTHFICSWFTFFAYCWRGENNGFIHLHYIIAFWGFFPLLIFSLHTNISILCPSIGFNIAIGRVFVSSLFALRFSSLFAIFYLTWMLFYVLLFSLYLFFFGFCFTIILYFASACCR